MKQATSCTTLTKINVNKHPPLQKKSLQISRLYHYQNIHFTNFWVPQAFHSTTQEMLGLFLNRLLVGFLLLLQERISQSFTSACSFFTTCPTIDPMSSIVQSFSNNLFHCSDYVNASKLPFFVPFWSL